MFNKPKWQHREAVVRLQAVSELRPDQPQDAQVLNTLALQDIDQDVRVAAVRRLQDPAILHGLMQATEARAEVRETAAQRWLKLVAQDAAAGDIALRLTHIDTLTDTKALEHLARHAVVVAIRLAALQKINKESLAADLAINDPDAGVRAAALAKVSQIAPLERVIKAVRTRDKTTYHAAKAKLDAAVEAVERPKRIREQAGKLIALIEQVPLNGDLDFQMSRYAELRVQWEALSADVDTDTLSRGTAVTRRIEDYLTDQQQLLATQRAAEAAWLPARAARAQVLERLQNLREELAARLTTDERANSECEQAIADLALQWRQAGTLPDAETRDFDARFERAKQAISTELRELRASAQAGAGLQQWMAQARALAQDADFDVNTYQRLRRNAQKRHDIPARLDAVWREFRELMNTLEQRAEALHAQQQSAARAFVKHLQAFEKALDEGHLDDATRAHRDAQKSLREAGDEAAAGPRRQWHAAEEKFFKMRDWRNWANTPQKERLIAQMEALIGSQDDPAEIAQLVRLAREEWQALGGGAADTELAEQLWQRFNQACESAYAPAKVYFAEQAENRQRNTEAREEFLTKLEDFLASANWATVDWRKVERLAREARVEWRALGITGRKARKELDERFASATNTLKEKLNAEWNGNRAKKEALIARITALQSHIDEQALNEAKQAMTHWKAIGHAGQRKEQALWQAFRAACDGVFARHREQLDQARAARDQERAAKVALIEKIVSLSARDAESLLSSDVEFRDLQDQWSSAQQDKKGDADLQRKYAQALQTYSDARNGAVERRVSQREKNVEQKLKLCQELEALLERNDATETRLADLNNRWEQSGDTEYEEILHNRYTRLCELSRNEAQGAAWRADLPNRLSPMLTLALQLEILADVDSPPELRQDRMALQVERLKTDFGKVGTADKKAEMSRLLREWYEYGSVPAAAAPALSARIAQVRERMKAHTSAAKPRPRKPHRDANHA